ncbi:kinase-like domain-containing protein, partial [Mycotypha africana]|uniref:kinase-like domain-containing protein n=1 Tax=Mycotypha africana TaxID=64632 RepID=UPI0023019427
IDHPNIIHFEETVETEDRMCIIIDYIEGGELFDFVQKMHRQLQVTQQSVDESLIKSLFKQLLTAVAWLHDHHIVHRDLKLENILIHRKNPFPTTSSYDPDDIVLKITDFGLARTVDPQSPYLVTRCGSEEYAAPEVIQQKSYDGRKTDTWALGIILYSLLVGYLPFRYDRRKKERVSQLFYRIVRADIKWPQETADSASYGKISNEAKFVVQAILERDPEKRISIHDVAKLPWFNS